MAIFNPIIQALLILLRRNDDLKQDIQNPDTAALEPVDLFADLFENLQPADEIASVLVEFVEEFILSDLEAEGALTPESALDASNRTEGAAVAVIFALGAAGTALEAASLGQIDEHQEYITQALAGLGVDDVTGMEMDARLEEGLMPALQARMSKEHRAKFVSLQDAVEYALRNKQSDEGWLRGETAPQDTVETVGSNSPVNPSNLIEEWGIRDDQLEILERVSLSAPEIEELVESPVQFGVVPSPEETEKVLQISGLPEAAQDLFRRTIEAAPDAADLWEQRTRTGDLVGELDSLVRDGTLDPDEAMSLLPDTLDEARPALRDRFELLAAVPAGTPSQSEFETAWGYGFIDQQDLEAQLDQSEFPTDRFPNVTRGLIMDEIDGDLQQALGLGLIDESTYGQLMDRLDLDAETQRALVAGEDLSDVADRRLEQAGPAEARPVAAVPGIGQSRSTALQAVGIATLADLAQASTTDVAEAAQVSPETAQELIDLAFQATT
jgi:hypothetical protein